MAFFDMIFALEARAITDAAYLDGQEASFLPRRNPTIAKERSGIFSLLVRFARLFVASADQAA